MLKSNTFLLNQPFFRAKKKIKTIFWYYQHTIFQKLIYITIYFKNLYFCWISTRWSSENVILFLGFFLPRSNLRFCANCSGVSTFLLPPFVIMSPNTGPYFGRDKDISLAYVTSSLMQLVFVLRSSSVVNK